jgi:GDPmannose 4,6-dehydratase
MIRVKKKVIITGVNGQDGSYLAELLLKKNYKVYGLLRRVSLFTTKRIDHIFNDKNFSAEFCDLTDSSNLNNLLLKIKPDEIYNLAAQSHVKVSFDIPDYTAQVDAIGTIRLLSAFKEICPKAKFYQASTSEIFGGYLKDLPQDEDTNFIPKSPYAAAKLYSYWISRIYRDSYNLFISNGILFNHESPRRGPTFVTKKITKGISEIINNKRKFLELGNLDAVRDWGYAKEYVYGMWKILQTNKPNDFIIATGKGTTVREFVEKCFKIVDINIVWVGKGLKELGICKKTKRTLVKINKKYFRPNEVDYLIGNPKKIQKFLNWRPTVNIDELAKIMMDYDLKYNDYGFDDS